MVETREKIRLWVEKKYPALRSKQAVQTPKNKIPPYRIQKKEGDRTERIFIVVRGEGLAFFGLGRRDYARQTKNQGEGGEITKAKTV